MRQSSRGSGSAERSFREQEKDRRIVRLQANGGFGLGKLVGWALLVGAGWALKHQWPEIQRYLKMRSM